MSTDTDEYTPLTEENLDLFNSYKEAIYARFHETFPSIPNNYEFKPISIRQQLSCGTTYTYKVTLPDNKLATVTFHLGGRRATPLVGPPHFEISLID